MIQINKIQLFIISTLVLIIGILFYFFAFDSYYFYDDITYLRYANQIANNKFHLTADNFCHRMGLIIPTAMLFNFFETNQITSTLTSFFCWIGCLFICFKLLKNNYLAFTISIIFCGLDYYHIFFINKAYPDMPLTFFSFLSLYVLYKQYFEIKNNELINSLAFSLTILLAFISKTTIIYLFPFYLFLFIIDFIKKENIKFWINTIIFSVIIFVVYFGYYYIKTGNPLFIFSSIENNHYVSSGSYYDKGNLEMLTRLTYEPLLMLINSGMIIPLVIIILTFNYKEFKLINKPTFWLASIISILGMFWFGTLSLKFYHPMALNPRMIILLVPPLAISASLYFNQMFENKKIIITLSIIFILLTTICALYINLNKSIVYLIISISLITTYFIKNKNTQIKLFTIGLLISLSIQPIYGIFKTKIYGFDEEKLIFENYLIPIKNEKLIIITDNRLVKSWDYYVQFNKPTKWQFIEFKNFDSSQISSNTKKYFLVKKGFCEYLNINLRMKNQHLKLITESNKDVKLYEYIK